MYGDCDRCINKAEFIKGMEIMFEVEEEEEGEAETAAKKKAEKK